MPAPGPRRSSGLLRGPRAAADGRVRRGERNRERILEPLFELIGEGRLHPTAEEVATRAGVGTRTVFRHFDDMERLYAEIDARTMELVRPLLAIQPPDGALSMRVAALAERRAALYERVAPFMRSAFLQRGRSPFLRKRTAETARNLRADLLRHLPELDDAPAWVADALETLTSFEAWDRLRREQRLGRERAQDTLRASTLALIRSAR